ncbi:hypothetical protein MNB_SV-14-747 [hydrothermal vent metagenome]|uniref:Uncharacterized protein n=1 Tax=hydrothermal vent metagenome TaxID=652676 RepID=A0A1W1CBT5_9ZZZZ
MSTTYNKKALEKEQKKEISEEDKERAEEIKKEQKILATNAWHLARYYIEHADEVELIKEEKIDIGDFLICSEVYPNLEEEKRKEFIRKYAILEKATKNVTARTLVATRIYGQGFFHAVFGTSVGKYLLFLALMTIMFLSLLIINIVTDDILPTILIPFSAAGLGTCVFLLRITQEKLSTRQFDPAYIPSQLIRLSLGILAGGSIVFFPDLLNHVSTNGGEINRFANISIEQGTSAFILGYAVDIFYSLLDNIGGKVK